MILGPTKGENVVAISNMLWMSRRCLLKSWIEGISNAKYHRNFACGKLLSLFLREVCKVNGDPRVLQRFFSFLPNL